MNDESLMRQIAVQDKYIQSSSGLYVAWALATPPHAFGEWSFVSIVQELKGGHFVSAVSFARPLEEQEIDHIYSQPLMWWGVKLRDEPWALVQCRPHADKSYRHQRRSRVQTDSIKNTGV